MVGVNLSSYGKHGRFSGSNKCLALAMMMGVNMAIITSINLCDNDGISFGINGGT